MCGGKARPAVSPSDARKPNWITRLVPKLVPVLPAPVGQMTQLAEPGAGELLAAYSSMESSKRRRAVLSLARQLPRDET